MSQILRYLQQEYLIFYWALSHFRTVVVMHFVQGCNSHRAAGLRSEPEKDQHFPLTFLLFPWRSEVSEGQRDIPITQSIWTHHIYYGKTSFL